MDVLPAALRPAVVEVTRLSRVSGWTGITVSPAVVVVVSAAVDADCARVGGIWMGAGSTWFRTPATAPQEKAIAITAASSHTPTSLLQPDMIQQCQIVSCAFLFKGLENRKAWWIVPWLGSSQDMMTGMPSILIIEDDAAIRQGLSRFLADAGHSVESLSSGMEGVQLIAEGDFDAVVLDLGLPDVDGGQVLKMIRALSSVPVVVATARDEESEIVRILGDGADDYVIKPFSGAQILARIEAIMRRVASGSSEGPRIVGELSIDAGRRTASLAGDDLELTRKEFDFLAYLAENAGVVVSRRELLAEVWRQPYGGADKTVDVHLSVLRRKLGESAAEPRYLRTVHGVGVKLVDPDS